MSEQNHARRDHEENRRGSAHWNIWGAAPAVSMTAGTVLLKITGRRLIIDEMEKFCIEQGIKDIKDIIGCIK